MAATYVKLQDAFVSESGTNYGSWKYIGYEMKDNTVFDYEEETLSEATTAAIPSSATDVWSATPKAALNDCQTSDNWKLQIKTAATGNGAGYKAAVSSADCNVLVPGFGKLDETGAATIASN